MKSAKFMTPDDYVAALDGWQRIFFVGALREAIHSAARLGEAIRRGRLVYICDGPVLLIRAEEKSALFGFRRSQRLWEAESRLKAIDKCQVATIALYEGGSVIPAVVRQLVKEGEALNEELGDPRDSAKPASRPRTKNEGRS